MRSRGTADVPGGPPPFRINSYNCSAGRFLQTDPVPGGSANNYDYANQDPINKFDLDGRMCFGPMWTCNPWGAFTHQVKGAYRHLTISAGGCIAICLSATYQNGTLSGSIGGIGLLEFGPAVGWNSAQPRQTEADGVFACAAYFLSVCGGGGNRHRKSGSNGYYSGSIGTGFGGAAGVMHTFGSRHFGFLEL